MVGQVVEPRFRPLHMWGDWKEVAPHVGVELSVVRSSLVEVLIGQVIRMESNNPMIVSYIFGTVGLSLRKAFYNRDRTVSVRSSPFSTLDRAMADNG